MLFAQEDKVYLLTKSLEFSNSKGLKNPVTLSVGKHPTLFKVKSSANGITEVEVIQQNGKPVNKTMYVSTNWFKKGTSAESAVEFHVDPNKIVAKVNEFQCEAPKDVDPSNPCSVLESGQTDPALFQSCYEHIRKKLNITIVHTAYGTISKLYALPKQEQRFMASILTMYGEARGARPPEENMAMVMKVIENRTRIARESNPEANELDVVLQSSQFSMFNSNDPNWRTAINASSADLAQAMKVYALRDSKYRCENVKDTVCHYHVPGIDYQAWMSDGRKIKAIVNGTLITDHLFYSDVAWAFNPENPYKRYARKQGMIQ